MKRYGILYSSGICITFIYLTGAWTYGSLKAFSTDLIKGFKESSSSNEALDGEV